MELNRNPENYFTEVEQAAFSPLEHRTGHRLLVNPGRGFFVDIVRQRAKVDP